MGGVTIVDGLREIADRIVHATVDRLNVIPAVAWFKYRNDLEVCDHRRESQILARVVEEAERLGIPTHVALPVMRAQFRASRSVQQVLVQRWGAQVRPWPPADAADFLDDLRLRIDGVTMSLLRAVAALKTGGEIDSEQWAAALQRAAEAGKVGLIPDIPPQVLTEALAPFADPRRLRPVA